MADQGVWFKLWCSSFDDASLDNLDIADFGRWAKLGAYVKRHGTNGILVIEPPCRVLCSAFQVPTFNDLVSVLQRLPHIAITMSENPPVTGVTNATVTFCNWLKYQGDNSALRTRQWRDRVTPKKRREEKRGDEKRTTPLPPKGEPVALTAVPLGTATAPDEPCTECLAAVRALNDSTGQSYPGAGRQRAALHSLHERYGLDVVLAVVRDRVREWGSDREKFRWLRPETLFNPDKFESYRNGLNGPAKAEDKGNKAALRILREEGIIP